MENGRSRPSQEMVHRLADALGVPVRERDELLESAGFAGVYRAPVAERKMAPYCQTVDFVLQNHEPYPAFVLNRWWDVVDANQAAKRFFGLVAPELPPKNLIEWLYGLPRSARARFDNWPEAAYAFLRRVRRETVEAHDDERLRQLLALAEGQLADVNVPEYQSAEEPVMCPAIQFDDQMVRLVGMVARFSTAREVTLDELRVELMYPRDDASDAFFRRLAERPALRVAE
jgi:hypothetical protein